MSKNLSAKYYKKNKEKLERKNACERYQDLFKEEKEKNPKNIVVTKIVQKMKKKACQL